RPKDTVFHQPKLTESLTISLLYHIFYGKASTNATERGINCTIGYRYISKTSTPSSPTTETMLSISDQDKMVSRMLRPKYSLNIQNPVSLTWENINEPAPVAKTINSAFVSDAPINGKAMPAAIKHA